MLSEQRKKQSNALGKGVIVDACMTTNGLGLQAKLK